MTIPYTFANATTAIPLAELDSNFASPITLGNVAMTLSNTYTSIGNLTLTNVTILSGTINSAITQTYGNANAVVYTNASNVATTSTALSFNGTTFTATNDASISGLTVGKGGGSIGTNTVAGYIGLAANTTGYVNAAFGYGALGVNTTGNNNAAFGGTALDQNTTGSSNTALGAFSLYSNTTASNNTAVGYQAGYSNSVGTCNNFFGYQAGYSSAGSAGFQGNTFMGHVAGTSVTTGTANSFFGTNSGQLVSTGSKNTIIGAYTGNAGGLDIRTASNYIVLSDGDGNPRGVFDSGGNYLVGCTSDVTSGGFKFFPNYSRTGSSAVEIGHITGSSSGEGFVTFKYNGGTIGSITQNGTTAVAYNTTSDYRLKTDVAPIQNALATVEALNPVSFTWTDGRKDDGFLAHEIQAVIPNCVTGEKDAVNEDGTPKYQQMDNSGVIPFLVKAIQELNAKVTALEAKLGA